MSSVWPLGSALATKAAPIEPEAPGRLSTITGTCSDCDNRGARNRGMRSVLEPGGNGTTMAMVCVGNGLSCASTPPASAAASTPTAARRVLRIMLTSLRVALLLTCPSLVRALLPHHRGDAPARELALELRERQKPGAGENAALRDGARRELAREQNRGHAGNFRAVQGVGREVPLRPRPAAVGPPHQYAHQHDD